MACILAIFLKKGGHFFASSCLLRLHSEFSAMNFTKSTSRPLPYSGLLSNATPFASKMRCTFSQVCPEVMAREECIFMPVRSHQNEIIIKILQRSVLAGCWVVMVWAQRWYLNKTETVSQWRSQTAFSLRISSSNYTYIDYVTMEITCERVCVCVVLFIVSHKYFDDRWIYFPFLLMLTNMNINHDKWREGKDEHTNKAWYDFHKGFNKPFLFDSRGWILTNHLQWLNSLFWVYCTSQTKPVMGRQAKKQNC